MAPALALALVLAGDFTPPLDNLFGPELVLQVELTLDKPKDETPRSRHAAFLAALQKAKVVRVLHPRGAEAPSPRPKLTPFFTAASPCLPLVLRRGKLQAVLTFRKYGTGPLLQDQGAEMEQGDWTDLDPQWKELLAAAAEVPSWTEERMRAVSADQLFLRQKAALCSENHLLRSRATQWLLDHGAMDAVGKSCSPPGTSERFDAQEKALRAAPPGCPAEK